jgi:hypothetical protein
MTNKRLICILFSIPVLLLIPFIAMRFTNEVNWTPLDFVVMGAMLLVTGLGCELALRLLRPSWIRAATILAVLLGFVTVWGALVHVGG